MPATSHALTTIHVVGVEHAAHRGRNWSESRCGRSIHWNRLALTVEAARNLGPVCKSCVRVYCAQEGLG